MPSSHADDSQLLIRCPSCGQRFKVGEDLRERTVECGGCEHRFRIDDEVIVRSRKVYPGERGGADLKHFNRVPMSRVGELPRAAPMLYGKAPDPAVLEPMSPQRILAGLLGASGIVLVALMFLLGSSRGGMLDGMDLPRRLMMGGFAALLGIVMLVYANPKARLKALSAGVLLSAGMLSIPFFFRGGTGNDPVGTGVVVMAAASPVSVPEKTSAEQQLEELRNTIGTGPLDDEIARLEREGGKQHAVGIWMRGMDETYRYLIMDYVMRVTEANPTSHFYPRGDGDFLLVVTGTDRSLDQMAELAAPLGSVENVIPELSLIELKVRNENFVEGSLAKLSSKSDPAFYDLNKRELESIDLKRVEKAVQRLATAEPKIYQADIARKLIELLSDKKVDFKAAVCGALVVWSAEPGAAGDAALVEVNGLIEEEKPVPREMIALLVKAKNVEVIPVLDELWFKNPMDWEEIYGNIGPAAEAAVIRRFPETEGTIRYSAVRILGRVGGLDSLAVLKTSMGGSDPELEVLLTQATESIRERMSDPASQN